MIKPIARQFAVLAGLSIWLGGCSSGQGPFRIVQLCLAGPQEIPAFTGFMDEIAQSYQMEFTDRSGQAEAELRSIDNPNVSVPRPLVNIGADRAGEFSFGAGNLGLPTQQMAIGFNGKNIDAAKRFADDVVAKLSTKWHVYEVPEGRGALPLKCD